MPDLLIYEDIGEDFFGDGVSAKNIKSQLDGMTGDLTVRINSYGGDVFEGHAIYNLIRHYEGGTKTVVIDGLAASAASVIAMAGDEIVMPINAMMMIHDPWTISIGSADDFRKEADVLDQIKGTIVDVYASKTDMAKDEIAELMAVETWLNVDEAEGMGFAVRDESRKVVLNKVTARQWINHLPEIEQPPEPRRPLRRIMPPARGIWRFWRKPSRSDDLGN